MAERDTIYALSSGRPPAAIAVIRISGLRAGAALRALTGKLPSPRKAALARVRDPATSVLIDEALALWFPGPHSETGEDIAELQLHGGRAVIAAVLDRTVGASKACARPKPANSPGAPSRTASSISPRWKASPIWSRPRPKASAARRCVSCRARLGACRPRPGAEKLDQGAGAGRSARSIFRREIYRKTCWRRRLHLARELENGNCRGARRRPARRTLARGPGGRHRLPAQCRQIHTAQPDVAQREAAIVSPYGRHHPRCDRGASRSWAAGR